MGENTIDPAVRYALHARCTELAPDALRILVKNRASLTSIEVGSSRHERAREYVHRLELLLGEFPHLKVTLSDLAQLLNFERTYCSRVFQDITGRPFSEWIREVRIARAQIFLQRYGTTITDVAYAVGYRDITTFERAFRKVSGVSPGVFRKLNRKSELIESSTATSI